MNEWEICISEWAARCTERDQEIESLKVRLAACEAECTKWQRIRTPTHGPCCTCQRCGLDYDACRCGLDEVADELTQAEARVQALEQDNARLREVLMRISEQIQCDGPSCFYCDDDAEHPLSFSADLAKHALEGG